VGASLPISGLTAWQGLFQHGRLQRLGDQPTDEAEHFIRCPACGGWIDCRDLGQALEHDGPLPHPTQDQPQ
jgi:hypothetical protein